MVYLTRQEHFNAAHKLFNPAWSVEQNEEVFGKCANQNWHGHNYDLYVTVKGAPDPDTGFVFDVKELSRLIKEHVIEKVDMILLMSVNPGFGGQSFIPSALGKLEQARKLIDACGKSIRLEIDGGVKTDNIRRIAEAGADTFVAGSAIFGSKDYAATIRAMREQLAAVSR